MRACLFLALAVTHGAAQSIGKPCFANETAMELFVDMDLTGRVAVVTGADKGIGLEIAKALAARRATVIPGCRTLEEVTATVAAIKREVPYADILIPKAPLDLSSFSVVRAFAESLHALPALHILVNDAALDNNPHQITTKDGFELAFQIDYPSQWLLTNLLLPQLRKGKGRIVSLVSKAYRLACVMSKRWQCMDLNRLPPPVITGSQKAPVINIPVSNYGIARLLMIRWTEELARQEAAAGTGVTAYTVNPGFVATDMAKGSNVSPFFHWLACKTEGRPGSSCPALPAQGALTPTFLALAPGIETTSGRYYEWCEPAEVTQCTDFNDGNPAPLSCPGASDEYKLALNNLTASWVANFTLPFTPSPALLVV